MAQRKLKMSTPLEVRQAATRVANMVANGDLDPRQANAILYAANVVLGSLRVDEQQRKIDELEKMLEGVVNGKA